MTTLNGHNTSSARLRQDRAHIRAGIAAGRLTLAEVLEDPPECLGGLMLFELAKWRYGWGPCKLRQLGVRAVRDRVNLAVSVGASSDWSRGWLAAQDNLSARYERDPA